MDSAESLFKDVHFYIFDKNVEKSAEIKAAMKAGGASREFYLSDLVTHIISDLPIEQSTLNLLSCHVLHSDWVVMSVKCGAQLPTVPFDLRKPKLFSGLTFTTSKLSRGDMEKLAVLVMYHGGKFQTKLDHNITHLVTMETSGAKYECAVVHADTVNVVTPDWLLDSIDQNKRVEEDGYHPFKPREENGKNQENSSLIVTSSDVQIVSHENGTSQPKHPTQSPLTTSTAVTPLTTTVPCTNHSTVTSSTTHITTVTLTPSTNTTETVKKDNGHSANNDSHLIRTQPVSKDKSVSSKAGVEDPSADLLSGMVVCLCDYQEYMDSETVDKWTQVIQQHGGSVINSYDKETCTHLLSLHKKSDVFSKAFDDGKCIASAHWLNDVLTEQKMFPPRNALHFPTAFKWQLLGADKYSMTLSNYTDTERELVKDMIRICGIHYTGHLDKGTTHLICKRPEGKKYVKAQEWGVQVINSTFLADIIHNGQAPAVLFPRYTRLSPPDEFSSGSCFEAASLLKQWKSFMETYTKAHPGLVDQTSTAQILMSSQTTPTNSTIGKHDRTEKVEQPGIKKQKLEDRSEMVVQRVPVVLVTGISQSVAKTLKNSVVQLGGKVTEQGGDCSHIVLPRVTRTVKLLCGISVCEHIVTPAWVESSVKEGRFVAEEEFALVDKDAEELFGMDVTASLERAKSKKLLQGLCLHSTVSVQPPHSALKDIVHCAGGELLTLSELKSMFGQKFERALPSQLLIISTPEDVAGGLCSEFFSCGLGVYNAELVLTGILKQELNFSLYPLLTYIGASYCFLNKLSPQ